MSKILITTSSIGEEALSLCKQGNEVTVNPYKRTLKTDELIPLALDMEGIVAGTEIYNKEVIDQLPNLKVISRCGVGMDSIDLRYAEEKGIKVVNTPDGPTLAVAELTIELILNLLRKVTLMDRKLRTGKWKKEMGSLLHGKKAGIVGLGRIGKKVAGLLSAFGVEIAYCDIVSHGQSVDYNRMNMDDLLSWSDIVLLHCSNKEECKCMSLITGNDLMKMKPGAILVNTARGGVVNEKDLYEVLKEGHLAGAALDVFEKEPYTGPLAELENVILTPHIGSYAKEARVQMEIQSVENLLEGLRL